MTAYPAWTPASRPGIIPLHPLGFGTILGRSFAALRQNPRVLLGFALVVQTLGYLVTIGGIIGIAAATFSRLDTVPSGTDEFDTIMVGSIVITAVAAFVLSVAAGVLGVIVQAIVVQEVARAALAEKLPLRELWRRVKPSAWRVIGYAFLLGTAVTVLLVVVAAVLIGIGFAALPVAIGLGVLVVLAAIPLWLWLTTKLALAPAAIIMERATVFGAISRSWTLTRGRFWPILGVLVLISLTFGAIAQVVNLPFSFLSAGFSAVFAPTGDSEVTAIIAVVIGAVLTQVVTLLIQAVAVVVQSSAVAIIYIDCRMRHEGLDLELLGYVESRDAGATGLPDPYLQGIGRQAAPRPVAWAGQPGGYAVPGQPQSGHPGYAQPGYPQPGHPLQGHPQAAYPPPRPAPPGAASGYPPPPPLPSSPPAPQQDPQAARGERTPTDWQAPGGSERES